MSGQYRLLPAIAGALAIAAWTGPRTPAPRVDVTTERYDNGRSGANTQESILNHDSVRHHFGKLWTLYADAKIMAQPLYVSDLAVSADRIVGTTARTRCAQGCNAVIFATMKGTVYAYMADQAPGSAGDTLLWATYLSDSRACHCAATGPKRTYPGIDFWATDDPWYGVLSTPVIDRATQSLYVVDWTDDDQYRLYNLDLRTGHIRQGPVRIDGSFAGKPFTSSQPGWRQMRKQRAALLLGNGSLFIAFGGDNPYTGGPPERGGWLFVYDARTLAPQAVWSPVEDGQNGGIWQSGQGPIMDAAGDLFVATGDGDFDPARHDYADSLLRLQWKDGTLRVADYYAPCNAQWLQLCDLDVGSSGPLLFDDFLVSAGKNGELSLMRADHLGGYTPGPKVDGPANWDNCQSGLRKCTDSPAVLQKWQASPGHIHGAPIFWRGPGGRSWLYVMGEGEHLQAYPFDGERFQLARTEQSVYGQPHPSNGPECQMDASNWMPGGILSVSSHSSEAGTGIVWALAPINGNANACRGVKGMLLALNAEDVRQELWRSQGHDASLSDTQDSFGLLARFNPPTIANGKVFVGTAGDAEELKLWKDRGPVTANPKYGLAVYGLH